MSGNRREPVDVIRQKSGISRRTFVAAGATTLLGGFTAAAPAIAQNAPIKVGALVDLSGPLQPFGQGKMQAIQLAAEEINAAGGLLGRKIELVQYDTQSENQLYGQFAQQLALRDKVAVVHGAITSAAREVARPVLKRAQTLYFYNMIYEGGLCDQNTFVTGPTPQQLLQKLIPYIVNRFGKRVYILAADYNFGHYSAEWVKKIAKESGGEVVGSEFFPLEANSFGPTIARIQQAKADVVFNVFVGPAHASFYGQWAAAGMNKKIPMASHTLGDAGDQKRMPPEVSEGLVTVKNYFDEIDSPKNKAFLANYAKKFGANHNYIGSLSVADYQAMYLWAEAVKKAGSIERAAVIKALESGISIDGPSGKVTIDPATHHCVLDMYLAEMKGGDFKILEHWAGLKPMDGDARCDLIKNPSTNQQFGPQF
ncbi:MAG TPA: ABC transporter substrate-binding protein [Xanthobacteraceae bacterium]|nr:ABC transporter substrate-binding protein [Xanthobacteraceae bacterium]